MSIPREEAILQFWFGELGGEEDFPAAKAALWFTASDPTDEAIRTNFFSDWKLAAEGKLVAWGKEPHSALALMILLDQFSRNLFRGTSQAFVQDEKARDLAERCIETGMDLKLFPVQAGFLYLPFEHSERLVDQERSVVCFEALVSRAPVALEFPMCNALDYAKQHFDIINRFGRFPHRNLVLGRESTPEEKQFLKEPKDFF